MSEQKSQTTRRGFLKGSTAAVASATLASTIASKSYAANNGTLKIALVGCGVSEVLLLTPPGYDCPGGAIACSSERELLRMFDQRVRELDPDVITGWNVIDFDIAVLLRMAQSKGVALRLGRGRGAVRLRASSFARGQTVCTIPGRVVLDGPSLLRGSFVKLERYGLNSVAREVLGRGDQPREQELEPRGAGGAALVARELLQD